MGPGDELDLVDGAGTRVTCTVLPSSDNVLLLEAVQLSAEAPPKISVTLMQALAKGGRDEQAIEMCTELGVDRIIPWQAQRSIVRWSAQKADKAKRKWVNVVRAAVKQSRRAFVPAVEDCVSLSEFLASSDGLILVAHEEASTPISAAVENWTDPNDAGQVTVLIGPEGGVSEQELQALDEAGAVRVRIGPNVLRSSTAGAAALSIINVLTGRWR